MQAAGGREPASPPPSGPSRRSCWRKARSPHLPRRRCRTCRSARGSGPGNNLVLVRALRRRLWPRRCYGGATAPSTSHAARRCQTQAASEPVVAGLTSFGPIEMGTTRVKSGIGQRRLSWPQRTLLDEVSVLSEGAKFCVYRASLFNSILFSF